MTPSDIRIEPLDGMWAVWCGDCGDYFRDVHGQAVTRLYEYQAVRAASLHQRFDHEIPQREEIR